MRTIVVLLFAALSFLSFTVADADVGTFICTVTQAGPTGTTASGGGKIVLTDTGSTFTNKVFRLPAERTKEFLAVALTAMTNDKKVKVRTDDKLENITAIYLFND